jgi:hypothetical protein
MPATPAKGAMKSEAPSSLKQSIELVAKLSPRKRNKNARISHAYPIAQLDIEYRRPPQMRSSFPIGSQSIPTARHRRVKEEARARSRPWPTSSSPTSSGIWPGSGRGRGRGRPADDVNRLDEPRGRRSSSDFIPPDRGFPTCLPRTRPSFLPSFLSSLRPSFLILLRRKWILDCFRTRSTRLRDEVSIIPPIAMFFSSLSLSLSLSLSIVGCLYRT